LRRGQCLGATGPCRQSRTLPPWMHLLYPPMAGVPLDAFPRANDNGNHGTKIGNPQSSLPLKKARKIGNYWPHGGYRNYSADVLFDAQKQNSQYSRMTHYRPLSQPLEQPLAWPPTGDQSTRDRRGQLSRLLYWQCDYVIPIQKLLTISIIRNWADNRHRLSSYPSPRSSSRLGSRLTSGRRDRRRAVL
jgi:hypothetical protein